MNLPIFVIIGEQKCGTGWLRDRLREHPDAFCHPREINFFNARRQFSKGLDWYLAHFSEAAGRQAVGEKSPDYFWIGRKSPDYITNPLERLAATLPQARVVLCLRNPVDRAISAINHHLYHRGRRVDPWLARRADICDLVLDPSPGFEATYGVVERGFYLERTRLALDLFGDRLLILIFEEDVVSDPERGLQKLCQHLGLDHTRGRFQPRDNGKEHKPSFFDLAVGHVLPVLRPVLRRLPTGPEFRLRATSRLEDRLNELYANDIAGTLALLGRPGSAWPVIRS